MALITLPTKGIRSIDWTPPPRSAWVSKSVYSGKKTIIDRGTVTQGWRASVEVAPRSAADILEWRSWQAQMRGVVNEVDIPATPFNQVALATVYTIGSTPASNSFTVAGLPINQTNYLRAGQPVTFYIGAGTTPRLATLTSNLSTNGSGVTGTVTFEPPLPLSAGVSQVVFQRPFARMRLASGDGLGWQIVPGQIYLPASFDLEEVV